MQQKCKGLLLQNTEVFEKYEVSVLTVLTCSYKPVALKLITKKQCTFYTKLERVIKYFLSYFMNIYPIKNISMQVY